MAIKQKLFKNGGTLTRCIQERDITGSLVRIFLLSGSSLHLKVTSTEPGFISGFDDERMDITISTEDIDYVIGGLRVG